MNKFLIAFTIYMLVFINNGMTQETDCSKILSVTKEAYLIGDFKKVKEYIEPCIKLGRPFESNADKNRALEILALTYIALDSTEIAKEYILNIIKTNADYIQDIDFKNIVFMQLFNKVKAESIEVRVSSVSKKSEDINSAPASVELITREDLINRGYVDLVDALSDIPGFQINKIYATTYANIFQLGYRQENTERTLLMVDGVEENDLWLNWAYLSRQYPITSIKAVEVIYGPSSTMYGPKAFVGAINIITYDPKELPKTPLLGSTEQEKYRQVYLNGSVTAGQLNTKVADLTMGIRGPEKSNFSLQLTGRYFKSDEHDMSSTEFFDYDLSDIDHLSYDKLNLSGKLSGGRTLNQYMSDFKLPETSPYYTVSKNVNGDVESIKLTDAGKQRARELDKAAYKSNVNGYPVGFSNDSKDYYVGMKMKVENLLIGFRHWKTNEGFGMYQDINEAGSRNGSRWAPKNTTMFVKIDKNLSEKFTFSNLSTFAIHRLGKESDRVSFMSFGDPQTQMHFAHLLNPDSLIMGLKGYTTNNILFGSEGQSISKYSLLEHGWRNKYFFYEAQQLRNEARFYYVDKKWDISSGIDLRSTQTQGDYLIFMDYKTKYNSVAEYEAKQKKVALAQSLGTVEGQVAGSNIYSLLDVGVYFQAAYKFTDKLSVILGTRADYNRIRSFDGFGLVGTPRIAVVYHTPIFTIKGIVSKGLQNASQWTRFSTGSGRVANPFLKPEEITFANIELSGKINKDTKKDLLNWEITGFGYRVFNAVASETFNGVKKNYNTGTYEILGTMANLSIKPLKNIVVQMNHTYTLANQTSSRYDSTLKKPIKLGDIASHMANISITSIHRNVGPFNFSLNLRGNYVSNKPEGKSTTQRSNAGVDSSGMIPAYLIFHGNIGMSLAKFPYVRFDFTVNNLLNGNLLDPNMGVYYSAGPREAAGTFNLPGEPVGVPFADKQVPYFPQRGRFMMLRMTLDL
jgi:outer membrane receptor for ferrienterochelin and colicin